VPDRKHVDVYIACFHSQPGQDIKRASGQFEIVEKAILAGEWPYDNGDDPSFFQARRGNPLTWGVCRQNVRNAIQPHDIVIFVSFTKAEGEIRYRFCAVSTVGQKLDHRYAAEQPSLKGKSYINLLIEPDLRHERWLHCENDRRLGARHKDWLWRIADHDGINQETFNRELGAVYRQGWFSNTTTIEGKPLRMANNYVLFNDSVIARNPPVIAHANQGSEEIWTNKSLKDAIFASAPNATRRNIRTKNPSIAHPHIRWSLESAKAKAWKAALAREIERNSE